jgi:hypothetical protein
MLSMKGSEIKSGPLLHRRDKINHEWLKVDYFLLDCFKKRSVLNGEDQARLQKYPGLGDWTEGWVTK